MIGYLYNYKKLIFDWDENTLINDISSFYNALSSKVNNDPKYVM